MTDLERAKETLKAGGYTCVLCRGEEIHTATARGVRPLVDWLDMELDLTGFSAADKVVGKATAILYCLLRVKAVYASVMSGAAKDALERNGIAAFCDRVVPAIINRRGDGPCPFEAAVWEVDDPHVALDAIREQQWQMRMPDGVRARVAGLTYTLDQTGMSGSRIALFDDMVLKAEPAGVESENNLAMLRWLKGKIPVPKVLHTEVKDGFRWLLMTRLEGSMSCVGEWRQDPQRLVRALADAMKRLWAVEITDCPVDLGLTERLDRAAEIKCDMDNVDPETFGENGFASPAALLDWLRENRPEEDRVLSHGDFCLPNVFLKEWTLSGVLDLGRSGISSRWQDIALCWRSLRDNLGGAYGEAVPGFDPDCLFDALGVEKDEEKLRYYLLLDELF